MIYRLLSLLIGYVFGLFETGFFIGKIKKRDIRESGSGNLGSTNALRTYGKLLGFFTLLGDAFKCFFAMLLCMKIFGASDSGAAYLYAIYGAFGAVIGHDFPFFLKFKGGKGVACMSGMILFTSLAMVPVPLFAFVIVVALTGYVSLASITVMVIIPTQFIIFGSQGWLNVAGVHLPEIYVVVILLALLTIFQHRSNIRRLLAGNENMIFRRKGK